MVFTGPPLAEDVREALVSVECHVEDGRRSLRFKWKKLIKPTPGAIVVFLLLIELTTNYKIKHGKIFR